MEDFNEKGKLPMGRNRYEENTNYIIPSNITNFASEYKLHGEDTIKLTKIQGKKKLIHLLQFCGYPRRILHALNTSARASSAHSVYLHKHNIKALFKHLRITTSPSKQTKSEGASIFRHTAAEGTRREPSRSSEAAAYHPHLKEKEQLSKLVDKIDTWNSTSIRRVFIHMLHNLNTNLSSIKSGILRGSSCKSDAGDSLFDVFAVSSIASASCCVSPGEDLDGVDSYSGSVVRYSCIIHWVRSPLGALPLWKTKVFFIPIVAGFFLDRIVRSFPVAFQYPASVARLDRCPLGEIEGLIPGRSQGSHLHTSISGITSISALIRPVILRLSSSSVGWNRNPSGSDSSGTTVIAAPLSRARALGPPSAAAALQTEETASETPLSPRDRTPRRVTIDGARENHRGRIPREDHPAPTPSVPFRELEPSITQLHRRTPNRRARLRDRLLRRDRNPRRKTLVD
ncbi:hypothetical protein ACMD2_12908 [Ananas comosus]|uniref:Uncharacterized protein n=1 Tax=Ananas comosus TaxID=4615 RepID=A0A199W2B0_ANACO|nr:hypothetical protein ACMD2_12908 [Ananas comosus]